MGASVSNKYDLEERTIEFSKNVIMFSRNLDNTEPNKIIINQLIRSSTSIGANYAEANNASSKLDFKNKIFLAKKEAAETRYWLRVLSKTNPELNLGGLIDECTQLLLILQKIINTLRNGN